MGVSKPQQTNNSEIMDFFLPDINMTDRKRPALTAGGVSSSTPDIPITLRLDVGPNMAQVSSPGGVAYGASSDPKDNPYLMALASRLDSEIGDVAVVPLVGDENTLYIPGSGSHVSPPTTAASNMSAPPAPPAPPMPPSQFRHPPLPLPHAPVVSQPVVDIQSVLERLRGAAPAGGNLVAGSGQQQASKDALQLFVGNVVSDGSTVDLKDFLNLAMRQVGLNTTEADPIISCRMNSKFSFIEFNRVEDCNAALNLNGIMFMGNNLKIDRPAKYAGPHIVSRTWQEITGQSALAGVPIAGDSNVDPSTKPFRELFIGNTPSDATAATLSEFLGGALQRMGLARPEGPSSSSSPITTVRVSAKFCFVEFRSVEEATNALNLNGIPYSGSSLNIKRSSKHDTALGPEPSVFFSWDDLLSRWMTGEVKLLTAGPVTNILCITNMVSAADLASEEMFADMIEDTTYECSQFGQVKSVFAPRVDARVADEFGGGGRLFVEMHGDDDAKRVLTALKGRSFDGRVVDVKFYPLWAWASKKYAEPLENFIISTAGVISLSQIFSPR